MAILKLKEAGDTATMIVTKCEVVEGQYGEQILFESDKGDLLYVPRTSADRQLERSGFDGENGIRYVDVVGETVTFFRAPNPKPGSAPFWNLAVETMESMAAKSKGNHAPAAKLSGNGNFSNTPNEKLPPLLRDNEATINRQLSEKINAPSNGKPDPKETYRALTEYVLKEIEPLYRQADIGLSDTAAAACVHTLFIQASRAG